MQYLRKKLRNVSHYAKNISITLLITDVYQNEYTDKRTLKNSNDNKVILDFQSFKKNSIYHFKYEFLKQY